MNADYFALLFPLAFADRPAPAGHGPTFDCGADPGPARCQASRVRLAERFRWLAPVLREVPCTR